MPSRRAVFVITASLLAASAAAPAFGQNPQAPVAPAPGVTTDDSAGKDQPSASNAVNCPPGVDERKAPTIGGDTTGSGGSLSDQLSHSEGVVCPPAGIDPGLVERPPAGGALRVIPPPAAPGGDPSINPK